ncbi:MAG: class II glutamine amidotransferase [Gammaproteobacteria bacterium]|nr:MAG: class II glutamine amidotransferase [Gammaproteobacteria bacterium]
MCELLGMSANVPTDIRFSFTGLMQRGGRTGPHRDGWGIAFYEGRGCRTFHDPRPGADSEVARLVQRYPIKSRNVVSHIRRASHGRVCLENTHPFVREFWGRNWSFAHNGRLRGIKKWPLAYYRPVGTTDSEHAFCWLLGKLRERYPDPPRAQRRLQQELHSLCLQLAELGTFNILMSDATNLFAFCTTRLCSLTRKAPFGVAKLIDAEMAVDFVEETTPDDVVTVIATRPLTANEVWEPLPPRSLVVFRDGLRRGLITSPSRWVDSPSRSVPDPCVHYD